MSGNPHRGDTPIQVGDQEYILCYDLNACAMIMDRLDISQFDQLSASSVNMAVPDLVYILWAGLQHHHEDLGLTEKDVGAMEWDLEEAAEKIREAFAKGLSRKTKPDLETASEKKAVRRKTSGAGKKPS